VARDIHDGLGHHLTVVGMQVQAARAVLERDPARADGLLALAEEQARQALGAVRDSVAALREARPAQRLPEQLQALALESEAAGLPTSIDVQGVERELDTDVHVALYRAAQEGLTNIHKHANAHTAVLRLVYLPSSVSLEVRDDGHGLGQERAGFGLVGIRERVDRLGGALHVESRPGLGVAVRVEVPG
jgi:signal transduction histidine kinase